MLHTSFWNRRSFLRQCGAILSCGSIGIKFRARAEVPGGDTQLAFHADDNGFAFNTGQLSGRLRQQGRPIGITPLHYKGTSSDLSQPYGICSTIGYWTRRRATVWLPGNGLAPQSFCQMEVSKVAGPVMNHIRLT
jgi:hypothetical protein